MPDPTFDLLNRKREMETLSPYKGIAMDEQELAEREEAAEAYSGEYEQHFVDYANDYFEGDYGQCLKHIIDSFRGMTPIGYEELQEQITQLQDEIDNIKSGLDKPKQEEQKRKTMSQRIEELKQNGKV
jgi:spore coat protein CotH